jgi:hypothetical protein
MIGPVAELSDMSQVGLTSSISAGSISTGVASSAAGSSASGAAERTAKLDAANHSLSAGQKALSPHPLDRDANTAADRDADGWTGGGSAASDEASVPQGHDPHEEPTTTAKRLRLPDDPCGGTIDVTG